MNNKKRVIFSAVVVGALISTVVFFNSESDKRRTVQSISDSAPVTNVKDKLISQGESMDSDETRIILGPKKGAGIVETVVADKDLLQQQEQEIAAVIESFNNNLSDKETRNQLKEKLRLTAPSYKQQVLAKVKQLNSASE